MAVMNHASGPTYIEPLDDEHAFKRDIRRGLPHVAYKKMPDNGASCPVTADSVYAVNEKDTDEMKEEDSNTEATKYLELGFIGDTKLYDLRGDKTHTCLTALFNVVKNVLQLSSLVGSSLVPKLVSVKIFSASGSGPNTVSNPDQSLSNSRECQYANRPRGSERWDNAAILTGWQLDGNSLGIAYVGRCNGEFAVSVSMFRNLDTTNIVAHEIGHNLDMKHDSNGNGCSSRGYVMAAYVNHHRADPNWSTCSRSYYNSFVGWVRCYNDST